MRNNVFFYTNPEQQASLLPYFPQAFFNIDLTFDLPDIFAF